MTAAATFAHWTRACLSSGHGGGDNLLRIGGERYVIGPPTTLGNGAITGRLYKFGPGGLADVGGYKIDADGNVVHLALPVVRERLAVPRTCECHGAAACPAAHPPVTA